MKTTSPAAPSIITEAATFIGIDYHKKYSVWHAVDAAGGDLAKGRIEHHSQHDFATLGPMTPGIFSLPFAMTGGGHATPGLVPCLPLDRRRLVGMIAGSETPNKTRS